MTRYFEYGEAEIAHLKNRDPKLGKVIERVGIIRREITPDPFEALISSIISQQISNKAAETVWNRFILQVEEVTPSRIAATPVETIQKCGMSSRKANYIKGIAEAAISGKIHFDQLHTLPDAEIIRQLTSLPGVGVWTAEMLLIFSLCRPNVLSFNDLAIRRGLMTLYRLNTLTREQWKEYYKRYSPYASVASLYLWEVAHENETGG
ncbi:MAG TPA: DNA-3-methyladenine glycosylase 2 family protein [Bacillota bacterium]|nr:DNA-3-methyladenine glycosylase 2 family protein [Bacillota bacterium]HPT88105.1 DNA-3-methyladenine glycosylase 2 family protein [Bacillota bacterium]